jgi:membrane protease YdiL (CAAX protease family)
VFLPKVWWVDLAFLALVVTVLLSGVLKTAIYLLPVRHVPVHVVPGHATLIHISAMSVLVVRRFPGVGYGFIPTWSEVRIGVKNFLFFVPFGAGIGLTLKLFTFQGQSPWLAPVLFLGYFWMVALSEEFAFRGVLQQTLGNGLAARFGASVAFGFVHLWFRGGFPNWRMMLLAMVAGWFYGRAFEQGGGIRASMVTHALTVTVWLVWLV